MTSRKSKGLRKAARLYRQRRYAHVISLLEPQVFMYRESWPYYQLLGMSCMYTGDYAGAYSYLRRAADLDEEKVNTLLGIGAVLLRRRQIDVAIANYLDILDKDPRNRRARRALQWLRTLDDPEEVIQWFETNKIRRILPPKGLYIPKPVRVSVILVLIAAVIYVSLPHVIQLVQGYIRGEERPGSEVLQLEETTNLTADSPRSEDGELLFRFDDREVQQLFREIGQLFNDSRDNLVRRELNRIGLSNADLQIKQQANLLRDYLTIPDFTNMTDSFSYTEVMEQPRLYDDVYVRWRGRIANLVIGNDAITFDLLVGYEGGRVVEGIVPVQVNYAVLLQDGQSVELIGRINAYPPSTTAPVSVTVSSIRTLNTREAENS